MHIHRWSSRPMVTNDRLPFDMRTNDLWLPETDGQRLTVLCAVKYQLVSTLDGKYMFYSCYWEKVKCRVLGARMSRRVSALGCACDRRMAAERAATSARALLTPSARPSVRLKTPLGVNRDGTIFVARVGLPGIPHLPCSFSNSLVGGSPKSRQKEENQLICDSDKGG